MPPNTERVDAIAALYAEHHQQLLRLVARRAPAGPQTVEDACSFAWAQLLSHPNIDLRPPRWRLLAWLTTTAMHEAWRVHEQRELAPAAPLDGYGDGRAAPSAENVAALRARLELVRQLPERPRRFLLRLALGYSYDEIAELEDASRTTTNKQIARAKRMLRELEAREDAVPGGENDRARAS